MTDHINGEVRVTTKDPLDIIIDPDAKEYDPKTWNEIFETKWMSLDEIEEVYGQDKADKLRMIAEVGTTLGADSMEYEDETYGDTTRKLSWKRLPKQPRRRTRFKVY